MRSVCVYAIYVYRTTGNMYDVRDNYSVNFSISQLKKQVEDLSKTKLEPFQLIQYRTGSASEPMTAHYLAQVGAMFY